MSSRTFSPTEKGAIWYLLVALLLATAMMAINWVGYDGADDMSYALSAEEWLKHFPVLGADHWALRHTIVLPVAASLFLFGQREISLWLPNAMFFLAIILVNYRFGIRFLGARAGGILAILLALTPEFIVQATYVNIDIVEVFFVSLSFWLMISGTSDSGRPAELFWSGIAAGLAFLTRETSVVLMIFFGAYFFFCPTSARRRYLLLGCGFLLVVCLQMAYLGILSGDPLYRYRLDAHHDVINRELVVDRTQASGKVLDTEGNLSVSVALNPLLMLFASQKYGLLFYIAIPMAIWLYRLRRSTECMIVRLASYIALLWILFVSSATFILYLVPRYYIVPAWGSLIIIAYGVHQLLEKKRFITVAGMLSALIAVNGLSLYLENKNPRFAERSLVQYLQTHQGVIVHTNSDTARRVALLARFAGVAARVTPTPANAGDAYFYSPRNLELCGGNPQLCAAYHPGPNWTVIGRFQEEPRAIGRVIRALHLASVVPHQIIEKMEQPSPGATMYRVPLSTGGG